MWLFLWVVFVLGAIGFFLWSYHATYEQKRAWKIFAAKYNLRYEGGRMMDSPAMTGDIKGRLVNFYPQKTENIQGQQINQTVVEVFLNKTPDVLCVVGSSGFQDFLTVLDLPAPFRVENDVWPANILARTLEDEAPEIWFAAYKDRVKTIQKLSKMPFDWVFVADGEQSFVAIRTQNSLSNPVQLNKVIKVLFDVVTALEKEPAVESEESGKDE